MRSPFRASYVNALTSGAHLVLLLIAWDVNTRAAWLASLAAIATISFFAWAGNFRRQRLIGDTPTSRVASAAQGYVELHGRALLHSGQMLATPLRGLPCVWYRHEVYRRSSDNKWEKIDEQRSGATFLLRDATGDCVVDPDDAEVITRHKESWSEPDYRFVQWWLAGGEPLYAIGDFATLAGAAAPLDEGADMAALLAEWKRDKGTLHRRFDLDANGELDLREWELARAEARREVKRRHREFRQEGNAVHVMRVPQDGRLYLLSNLDPDRLARRYRLWGIAHLAIFIGAGIAVAWLSAGGMPA